MADVNQVLATVEQRVAALEAKAEQDKVYAKGCRDAITLIKQEMAKEDAPVETTTETVS